MTNYAVFHHPHPCISTMQCFFRSVFSRSTPPPSALRAIQLLHLSLTPKPTSTPTPTFNLTPTPTPTSTPYSTPTPSTALTLTHPPIHPLLLKVLHCRCGNSLLSLFSTAVRPDRPADVRPSVRSRRWPPGCAADPSPVDTGAHGRRA